jgi:hypothetical protein
MTLRHKPRARNAGPLIDLPLFAHRPVTPPSSSHRARWIRSRHPLSLERAELIAALAFGVGDER